MHSNNWIKEEPQGLQLNQLAGHDLFSHITSLDIEEGDLSGPGPTPEPGRLAQTKTLKVTQHTQRVVYYNCTDTKSHNVCILKRCTEVTQHVVYYTILILRHTTCCVL